MQANRKDELEGVQIANDAAQAAYNAALATWQANGSQGAAPVAPAATAAPVYDVADVVALETVTTPWGDALLTAGMKKVTSPDGTVIGVTAADYAAGWQPVA